MLVPPSVSVPVVPDATLMLFANVIAELDVNVAPPFPERPRLTTFEEFPNAVLLPMVTEPALIVFVPEYVLAPFTRIVPCAGVFLTFENVTFPDPPTSERILIELIADVFPPLFVTERL